MFLDWVAVVFDLRVCRSLDLPLGALDKVLECLHGGAVAVADLRASLVEEPAEVTGHGLHFEACRGHDIVAAHVASGGVRDAGEQQVHPTVDVNGHRRGAKEGRDQDGGDVFPAVDVKRLDHVRRHRAELLDGPRKRSRRHQMDDLAYQVVIDHASTVRRQNRRRSAVRLLPLSGAASRQHCHQTLATRATTSYFVQWASEMTSRRAGRSTL